MEMGRKKQQQEVHSCSVCGKIYGCIASEKSGLIYCSECNISDKCQASILVEANVLELNSSGFCPGCILVS